MVAGRHGMGVSTPMAAAVAAATCGLDIEVHMPNGAMFTIGSLSMIVAAGGPTAVTRLMGSTLRTEGATPEVHCNGAPVTTSWPMAVSPSSWSWASAAW